MSLDRIALICALIVIGFWLLGLFAGVFATLPYGLPVLVLLAVVGYVVYRVIRERLANAEDDYYEKNIKQ